MTEQPAIPTKFADVELTKHVAELLESTLEHVQKGEFPPFTSTVVLESFLSESIVKHREAYHAIVTKTGNMRANYYTLYTSLVNILFLLADRSERLFFVDLLCQLQSITRGTPNEVSPERLAKLFKDIHPKSPATMRVDCLLESVVDTINAARSA